MACMLCEHAMKYDLSSLFCGFGLFIVALYLDMMTLSVVLSRCFLHIRYVCRWVIHACVGFCSSVLLIFLFIVFICFMIVGARCVFIDSYSLGFDTGCVESISYHLPGDTL